MCHHFITQKLFHICRIKLFGYLIKKIITYALIFCAIIMSHHYLASNKIFVHAPCLIIYAHTLFLVGYILRNYLIPLCERRLYTSYGCKEAVCTNRIYASGQCFNAHFVFLKLLFEYLSNHC